MKASQRKRLMPGSFVILRKLPPGLLRGLPRADQTAIRRIVGKPLLLERYEKDGRAVLTFSEKKGMTGHSIFIDPAYLEAQR